MRTGARTGPRKTDSLAQRFANQGDPRDAHGMAAAMRRFLSHRAVLGASEQGLLAFERNLRYFLDWSDERSVTHPQQVTLVVLERYQRYLHHYRRKDGEPLVIASQRNKLTAVRTFFKYLTRAGEIPANPAAELEFPKAPRTLPMQSLTAEEVERVLAQADIGTLFGLRDRAIMELLYASGMRRMEIAKLTLSDLDFERGVVAIREGKGRKDRLIPLGERAAYWVRRYLEICRERFVWNRDDKTLFLGKEGLPLTGYALSERVSKYIDQAQLGKRGACHMFRHTMATLMLEGGADIRFIQAMLGHEKLSTTQIYTHVAIRQLQLVHANTHPGAARHVRGAEAQADEVNPQADAENAAQTLLAALDAEADEEASGC